MRDISRAAAAVVVAASIPLGACASHRTNEPLLSAAASASRSAEEVAEPTTAAAEAFTRFSEGGRRAVPWAETVIYRIRGTQVARFGPDDADRRQSWDGCPSETTSYEGRDCPISPLRTIALAGRDGGGVVYEMDAPPGVGCSDYRMARVETEATVWIRPNAQRRDCFSDFAVAVSLDRSGRIVAVDIALSGP